MMNRLCSIFQVVGWILSIKRVPIFVLLHQGIELSHTYMRGLDTIYSNQNQVGYITPEIGLTKTSNSEFVSASVFQIWFNGK